MSSTINSSKTHQELKNCQIKYQKCILFENQLNYLLLILYALGVYNLKNIL